jgi:HEAT repeat protein
LRPVDTRIQAALATCDEDCRWELIGGAVTECPDDVLEAALELLASPLGRKRRLGADLLGRLVGVDQGTRPVASQALLAALGSEHDADALASVVAALGHTGDPSILDRVIPYAGHAAAAVRLATAFSVATVAPKPVPIRALRALVRLSRDDDPEVRDWATFGLGTLRTEDGPEVRDALLARTEDPYRQTRAEALFGLAVRRDPRAVPHLIQALESPIVGWLEVDAAAASADPRLLPSLLALRARGRADEGRVSRAIDRCSGRDRSPSA